MIINFSCVNTSKIFFAICVLLDANTRLAQLGIYPVSKNYYNIFYVKCQKNKENFQKNLILWQKLGIIKKNIKRRRRVGTNPTLQS